MRERAKLTLCVGLFGTAVVVGGIAISGSETFGITVGFVNQPPSFTAGPNQTALEDAVAQSVTSWATSISPGPGANQANETVTFLVTNDTPQKRREYLPQVERTLLLPESEKPEQMNEVVRAIRDIGGLTHTQLDTRTRSLTVRGSEHDVALVTALLRQLERLEGYLARMG